MSNSTTVKDSLYIARHMKKLYKDIKIGVLGVPFNKGQRKTGVSRGPEVIRSSGLVQELQEMGYDTHDYGDISYEKIKIPEHQMVDNMTDLADIAACMRKVSEAVTNIMAEGRKLLTLGGDHSVSIGSVDGHIRSALDVGLIWVDAHADLNISTTSPSGNVHGMSVALLTKELSDYWPFLPGMEWQEPLLSVRNMAYIGLRDVDSYERLIIDKYGIINFGMEEVGRYGIHEVASMALNKVDPYKRLSLHLSIDIDCLDTLEAPCTGTAVRGGLTLREAVHLVEEVFKTGQLNAVDLVEINPSLSDDKGLITTLEAAKPIIKAAFGYRRSGLPPIDTYDLPPATPTPTSTEK